MIFQNAQYLCVSQKALSLSLRRKKLYDLSIFSSLRIDFKTSFYTEFSVVINGLAIYLIDYRECIFTTLVQYSQLIN